MAALLIVPIAAGPAVLLGWLSLHQRNGFSDVSTFVGFENYVILVSDPLFWKSLKVTIWYTIITVGLQLLFGLLGSLSLWSLRTGKTLMFSLMILPYTIPTALVVFLWRWLLNGTTGPFSSLLVDTGVVSHSHLWFDESNLLETVILVSVWQFTPYVTLTLYAGLASIPVTRYEAATTDGLGPIGRFIHVTVPGLLPSIVVVLLLRGLWMFTKFDVVYLLGGKEAAGRAVYTLPIMAYEKFFGSHDLGGGSAVSVLMFIPLVLAVTGILAALRSDRLVS